MENGGTREMDSERTRKRMPTHQHDCLKGKGGATEQKQGGERSCFRASLTLDSQELQTPALRKKKFQFKKKKKMFGNSNEMYKESNRFGSLSTSFPLQ